MFDHNKSDTATVIFEDSNARKFSGMKTVRGAPKACRRTASAWLAILLLIALFAITFLPTGSLEPSAQAPTATIIGKASAIDGDTLEIHGTRIRLNGIDAPEHNQICVNASGLLWLCGQRAAFALADLLTASPSTCKPAGSGHDRYGRMIAVCRTPRGEDVGLALVTQGLAVAYRKYSLDYVDAEDAARSAKRGIWAGMFVMPEEWRRRQRVRSETW